MVAPDSVMRENVEYLDMFLPMFPAMFKNTSSCRIWCFREPDAGTVIHANVAFGTRARTPRHARARLPKIQWPPFPGQ
jgi:hypothetical protein